MSSATNADGFKFQTALCVDTDLRSRGSCRPRFARIFLRPSRSEGAGMPGADAPAAKKHARSAPRSHRKHPASPRNGLRLTSRSPRRSGSFATVTPEKLASQELDTSVEMSGPHDLAVRIGIARLARLCVHRIPSRGRDDRVSPLCGTERGGYRSDLGKERTGIFLREGLDTGVAEQPVGQIRKGAELALSSYPPVSPVFCRKRQDLCKYNGLHTSLLWRAYSDRCF